MSRLLEVKYDTAQMKRIETVLAHIPNGVAKASVNAINRALVAGRAAASKNVRNIYTISAEKVKRTISLKNASMSGVSGSLESRGAGIGLMHFKHRPTTDTTGKKRRAVAVTVKKGQTKRLATGFVSSKLGGNIFTRDGRKRLPIKRAVSVSVPQMMENAEVREPMMNRMQEIMEKRLDHEVNRILGKGKA